MVGPLLYKPAPKWQVLAALGGALAVHGIAVAFAFHKEPPPVDLSDIPTATIEATLDMPPADEPTPPPEDIPVPEAPPPPDIQPEFHEEQTPPPKQQKPQQKVQPIKAPQVAGPPKPPGVMSASQGKANAISAPKPEYPYEARRMKATGSGVCVVTVDTGSGNVTDATMAQSIGNSVLDNAALSAFRRWRFKPGTVSKVRIPITFTLTGVSY
jgi:periplasmic protein TonB